MQKTGAVFVESTESSGWLLESEAWRCICPYATTSKGGSLLTMKSRITNRIVFTLAIAGALLSTPFAHGAVNVGSSSWLWQNPLPQGDNLNSISCPSGTICYAVGELGTILNTINGGTTWRSQPSTTNVTLRGISCPSTTTCVAVGDGGTVVYTNSSGAVWSKQTSNTTAQLTSVSCPSTGECFAVGPSGVVGTLSLGSGWRPIVANTGFVAISCPSVSLGFPCYVAGHTTVAQLHGFPLFGGWRFFLSDTSPIPPINGPLIGLVAISCPNSSTCVSVSGGNAGPGVNPPNIIGTTNGGSSWTPAALGLAVYLNGVDCINPISGSGAPFCYAVGHGPGGENDVFFGNPGGSWLAASAGDTFYKFTNRNLNAVSCQPALVGSVTLGKCFAVGDLGAIVTDSPSAVTWTSQQTSLGEALGELRGVSCPAAGTCYAIGNGFYSSSNGGPWIRKNSTVGGVAISCPSTHDCFVGGLINAVLVTTDGGTTWKQEALPKEIFPNSIVSISCPSAQVCVAVGDEYNVFTTTGSTWSLLPSGLGTVGLGRAVTCPTTTMCMGISINGNFAFTTNFGPSGGTWTSGPTPTTNNLLGVSCETPTHCIAVGDSGGFGNVPAAFLDGRLAGTTWFWSLLTTPTPLGDAFSSVSCFLPNSNGLCYAATFQGEIVSYRQLLGGAIFNLEAAIDPGVPLQAISCSGTSTYECAAVGYEETILTKTVGSVGTGTLIPADGTSQAGDPTEFNLTWLVPVGQVWRDLQNVDLKLVDDHGNVGLWARFIPGQADSAFAQLDAKGNIVAEGLPGTVGELDSPFATLDLSKSSFVGTGPTGPSVTVTFNVSFKPVDAGNALSANATHVYDVEIAAAGVSGIVQAPEKVGSWVVRP
jgi:photosystem II stability/assembly factor-like uncharacterized protein